MASTRSGYLAVKKESTVGTAVKPTHFLHYLDGDLGADLEVITNSPIQSTRWLGISAVAGKMSTSGSLNMNVDYNEVGYWLGACLKFDDSPTDNGDNTYTHTFDTDDELQSLTIEQGKGDVTGTAYEINRAFGAHVDNLTINASDGMVGMSVDIKSLGIFQRSRLTADASAGSDVDVEIESVEGLVATDTVKISDTTPQSEEDAIVSISAVNKTIEIASLGNSYTVANEAKVELTELTPSYSAEALFSFDHCSFQFGTDLTDAASNAEENVEDWEFSYSNNIEERYGSLRKTPSVIAPKAATATLKFKRYFENVTDRDRYLNTTRQACIITIEDPNTIIGNSTRNPSLVIKISDLRYKTYALPTGTDELYVAEIEGDCYYDATDTRAVQIDLTTEVADFTA